MYACCHSNTSLALFCLHLFTVSMCMHVYTCHGMCKLEDNFMELVCTFHHVDSGNQIHAVTLGKHLYPLNYHWALLSLRLDGSPMPLL